MTDAQGLDVAGLDAERPVAAGLDARGLDPDRLEAVGLDVVGLDVVGLTDWLARAHPHLADGPLSATLITGGRSNLTYRVDGARRPLVVRRPPLGHVLSSAHDMAREHRIIQALQGSAVPVPPTVALVDDSATGRVTGTQFFVMDLVDGRVLSDPAQNADFTPAELNELGLGLARILAELHAIPPVSVGLEAFGRADGFLERQLKTWRRQLDASRTRDVPRLDELQAGLGERMPTAARATLVHGDYRLDNALVAGGRGAAAPGSSADSTPRITAILDWEMATIGDPLVDLGMLGLYWSIAELPGGRGLAPSAVDPEAGYPAFDELVDVYAARSGIARPDLGWYRAFAAYKLAVILEGIHCRYQAGETVGEGFDRIGELVEPLAAEGLARSARRGH